MIFRIRDNWVHVQAETDVESEARKMLDDVMKFHAFDYERTTAYLNGKWDGWTRLFDPTRSRFPRGMMKVALLAMQMANVHVDVRMEEQKRHFEPTGVEFEGGLYQFQQEILEQAARAMGGVISLPTGCGKTRIGLALIAKMKVPTVIFVHRKELAVQWRNAIATHLGVPRMSIGSVGEGVVFLKPITVAMVQSAKNIPSQLLSDFGMALFDEAHHVPSDTIYDIATESKSLLFYGLSATPRREDGCEMKITAALGSLICEKTWSEMISLGYLARPSVQMFSLTPIQIPRGTPYATVYQNGLALNEQRNALIVKTAIDLMQHNKRVYIHVRLINHGKKLVSMIDEVLGGVVNCGQRSIEFVPEEIPVTERKNFGDLFWAHGSTPNKQRREVIARFSKNDGRGKIFVSTLLGEGVDIPGLDALILAAGGNSLTATQQVIGRVLRVTLDKRECDVVDFIDNCRYLSEHSLKRLAWYQSEKAFKIEVVNT